MFIINTWYGPGYLPRVQYFWSLCEGCQRKLARDVKQIRKWCSTRCRTEVRKRQKLAEAIQRAQHRHPPLRGLPGREVDPLPAGWSTEHGEGNAGSDGPPPPPRSFRERMMTALARMRPLTPEQRAVVFHDNEEGGHSGGT